ncbi:probable ATP-dependent DNA helicase HFM1 isoform X2 [Astyanax mexicanus]|uniref:probable ATP-dependent DNA helicase HFM1 isoform X2 n=1 Tax=Astyanax mexicanus TaxID=7994 RepID=UPI0020CB3C4D|nr:probable ATP-dependent DNA helicase HFM1 isoform X2 [Astyanax mexicanus]
MAECEDFTLPLDSLFFVKPVVHKVNPLCQEQNVWQLDAPPSVSEIPATQAIQKEAECMSSVGCSQKIRKFLPPFQRPFVSAGVQDQIQADETGSHEMLRMQTSQTPSARKCSNHAFPGTQEFDITVKTRPCHPTATPLFKTRLFKPPMRMDLKSFSISSQTNSSVDDHSLSGVAMVTEHPPAAHAIATCSPFLDPGQIEECNSPQQKHDSGVKKAHVLPLTPKPIHIQGPSGPEMLRPVAEISAKFRGVFKEFPYFNYVQSKALDDILYTSKNFVACAPTGSGKTVLFELAIIRLLMETTEPWHNVKAVYMAPIKALCSQQYENWKLKFGPLGLNCKELTGDTEIEDVFEIQDAHLIMTTPEKWDSMTRKWKNNCLLQSVQLFLIDEVHVVKDSTRGPTLEVVVSRMKTIHSYTVAESPDASTRMRFVAVSATIPNICDIADWLSNDQGPATCLEMDESHRPVKLRKVVLGFPFGNSQNEFKFDLSLNYKMASVIQTYSDQKPTLVFCSTRKGVQQSATVLAKDARFIMSIDHRQRLMKYASSILDAKLRDLIMCGVGYHHAGVSLSDRKVVEDAFTAGDLPVLFTTSTLAMGVNLPAHLVVIKSTMHYAGGSCEEYSEADMLQMIGRAGRPQFDTSATAVIMTRIQNREKYLQFISGSETIESSLHTNLVEHLNAEIVLHTISDVNMALDWIRSTFLYIRALKNPTHYGFSSELDKCGIETKLQELCLKNLNSLASYQLITMDEDINIKPTESGKLMARYCVAFDTMKQFSKLTGTENLAELIEMMSKGKEFSDVQLRVNEKRTLNTLNIDKNRVTIRYPMEGKIKSKDMKVNCLIQAQLGNLPIQEFGLTQDTGKIFRSGVRISKCLAEFLSHHSKQNFSAQLNSLILAKCFRAKLWEDSPYVSKQLDKIGLSLATAMVNAGLTSFSKIEATNPRELELIVNRHPPFGNQIKEAVSKLPKYEIRLEQLPKYSVSTAEILVTVNLKNFEELLTKRTAPDHHYVTLIIGDCDNNVVFQQKIQDTVLLKSGSWSRKIEVTRTSQEDKISINLISSEYVGLDIQQTFTAFYYGAKTFRAESYGKETPVYKLQKIPETSQRATSSALKSNMAPPRAQSTVQRAPTKTEPGKRECNHFCKNKDLCGHDCCKVGIQLVMKRPQNPENSFSSYLRDLKTRNEKLLETPVKRLKMRMNAEAENISMPQFSFSRRETMPAHTRFEESQDYPPSVSHSMEPQQGFAISAEASFNEDFKDFHHETEGTVEEQMFQTDANNTFQNAYTSRIALERQMSRIPAHKSRDHTTSSCLDHSTDNISAFDGLNVTFDLAIDDWDDFDDDNLVLASDVSYSTEKQGGQCVQSTAGTQDCWTSAPSGCSEPRHGLLRPNQITRVGPTTTVQETREIPEISAIKHPSLNLNETETLPRGRLDFFSKRDPAQDTQKGFGRDQKEENKEADMFVSIFDGIF